MLNMTWEQRLEYTHPYIAPPELVDAENRKVPMSTAAANSGGVSLLRHHLKRLGTLECNVARMRTTEYGETGCLAQSNKSQEGGTLPKRNPIPIPIWDKCVEREPMLKSNPSMPSEPCSRRNPRS